MELEGFGASLVGKSIYVVSDDKNAWIPWEFISGVTYSAKLLISGYSPSGVCCIEAENSWTAIFRPMTSKDWSCIATMLRGIGNTILLTFDHYSPVPPASFINYLDSLLMDSHITITRVWIGTHVEIPTIPDALLFPPFSDNVRNQEAFEMIQRLPARNGHGPWAVLDRNEWNSLIQATSSSDIGLMVSDICESKWTLFWHKLQDSRSDNHSILLKRGLLWMRTGGLLIEKTVGRSGGGL
jgi:hypothetical protein